MQNKTKISSTCTSNAKNFNGNVPPNHKVLVLKIIFF